MKSLSALLLVLFSVSTFASQLSCEQVVSTSMFKGKVFIPEQKHSVATVTKLSKGNSDGEQLYLVKIKVVDMNGPSKEYYQFALTEKVGMNTCSVKKIAGVQEVMNSL